MGLTDVIHRWRGSSPKFKKKDDHSTGRDPIGEDFKPESCTDSLPSNGGDRWWTLLNIMSRDNFVYFLYQQRHSPKTYRLGTEGNGTNEEFEVRLRIASSNNTGLSGLPENYMTD